MTLNLTPDLLTVPLPYPIVTLGGSFMDKIPEMINISQLNRGYAGKILLTLLVLLLAAITGLYVYGM